MRIGYACVVEAVPTIKLKSCTLKKATQENLREIIKHNLDMLDKALDYNNENNIKLFRISSDIIPLASHPLFDFNWKEEFIQELALLGKKTRDYNIRLSMHPGQYTILNSNNDEVVKKAIMDLIYHCDFLDLLGLDSSNKIIIHIGGVYGDKESAIQRFIDNYLSLDQKIKNRLVIENDDKLFNINDVYRIGNLYNIPVVFDNLHHFINNTEYLSDDYWINLCKSTWKTNDGVQKIHYSQQAKNKKNGAHSKTILTHEFMNFTNSLSTNELDIMLEVKDKNISAIKCNICLHNHLANISLLEKEWAKYKYIILEKDQNNYLKLRELLKNKKTVSPITFFELIDKSIIKDTSIEFKNASLHIWGYFKGIAIANEKEKFFFLLNEYNNSNEVRIKIKNLLFRLASKYQIHYLLYSYFFIY